MTESEAAVGQGGHPDPVEHRRRSIVWCGTAYGVALVVATATVLQVDAVDPIRAALYADLAATLAIFAFSVAFSNSSFYDAYWSVAPLPILLYWIACYGDDGVPLRQSLVVLLVATWGARLSWNWLRSWEGLRHEDWRYVGLRERTGALYWPTSLVGLHLMPTLIVFLACLPLVPAVRGAAPLGWLDGLALLVTGGAIAIEAVADAQLRRFRQSEPEPGAILATGLWARSRHPNYFGEMGFWFGLWLFGLAGDPAWVWTIAGPLVLVALFRFASLPMIEGRMAERRPGWAEHAATTPLVIPSLRKRLRKRPRKRP